MEDELDAVSRGEKEWVPVMHEFWDPFKKLVDHKEENVSRKDVTTEAMDEKLPEVQQAAVHPLGPPRPLHRLHRLSGLRLHPQPGRDRRAGTRARRRSRAASARNATRTSSSAAAAMASSSAAPATRNASTSNRWRSRRTRVSSAPSASRPPSSSASRVTARFSIPARAIRTANTRCGTCPSPALPQMRLADPHGEDHQTQRHRTRMPA